MHYMVGWRHYQRNELVAAEASFRKLADISVVAHATALVEGYMELALTALAHGHADGRTDCHCCPAPSSGSSSWLDLSASLALLLPNYSFWESIH